MSTSRLPRGSASASRRLRASVAPTTSNSPRSARTTCWRCTSASDPLLVRGPLRMFDQDGTPIDAGRETVALCRCGKSRLRPFCDGTHKLIRFKAPSGPERGRG